jgi:hypothetical protein
MTDAKQLSNLYNAGMAFAGQLRLLGQHDLAHYIEVMTFRIQKEVVENDTQTKTES